MNSEYRKAFEAWMRSTGETPSAFMESNGCYVDSSVQNQWMAFRAAYEAAKPQPSAESIQTTHVCIEAAKDIYKPAGEPPADSVKLVADILENTFEPKYGWDREVNERVAGEIIVALGKRP